MTITTRHEHDPNPAPWAEVVQPLDPRPVWSACPTCSDVSPVGPRSADPCNPDKRAELLGVAAEVRAIISRVAPVMARAVALAAEAEVVAATADRDAEPGVIDTDEAIMRASGGRGLFDALSDLHEMTDPEPAMRAALGEARGV